MTSRLSPTSPPRRDSFSPRTSSSLDEKRSAMPSSIDVPGIVLTEASCDRPTSPPPKSIVLLSPACVAYPPPPRSPWTLSAKPTTARTLAVVLLVVMAAYHLYSTLDLSTIVPVHAMVP
ncbi:uncharacterized protein LOC62_03G004073 [Vanrija pseudolonga]|uniref:Uncharacterized protein n=1 Tax=Vanrija pseudolonga TaxID=143232 RepID=A0AAF1BHN9_9TREE|nr:hypothetical protein LOC62_03G004073 [Vanrija pseudolonga]